MANKKNKKDYFLIIGICIALLCVIIFAFIFIIFSGNDSNNSSLSETSAVSVIESPSVQSEVLSNISSEPLINDRLNENYSRLLLVNGNNPLPQDYDYTGNLITIDKKYLCGYRNQMDKDAYIYAKALVEAAWKDNVELYILSPYRSYSSQNLLFENEVKTHLSDSITREEAEIKASTEVARPGTSEHHTGLAIDFNSVEGSFENTEAFAWLKQHGEEYGFVLRYPNDKQNLTGVIYEPWHWRFVGIKNAKEMNKLGMCLEEYTEYLKN